MDNKGGYGLIRSDRKDVQRLVEQYKINPDNRPSNLLESFLELNPLKATETYLVAKEYNDAFNEDKRLKVRFTTPTLLSGTCQENGQTISFFTALEHERRKVSNLNGYEGVAVYVFCENESDLDMANRAVTLNNQQRVLVAIPRNPIIVYDAIFTLKALTSNWFEAQSQNFSTLEKVEEKTIRDKAIKDLDEAKKAYFSNAKMVWFWKRGTRILVAEDTPHDAANST